MPAVSTPRRGMAGLLAAVLLTTGCQSLDDTGITTGRADLINELADRLNQSSQLTYTADYRLPGGRSGSIAQAPPRTVYRYPGGTLTVTRDAAIACLTNQKPASCTVDPPPGGTTATASLLATAQRQGLVTPPVAVNLLAAAALDPNVTVKQTGTTVAGRHATCVSVRQLSNAQTTAFDICVTVEGVLGSFEGVLDGVDTELALSQLRDAVDQTTFATPDGAGVIDRRSPDAG